MAPGASELATGLRGGMRRRRTRVRQGRPHRPARDAAHDRAGVAGGPDRHGGVLGGAAARAILQSWLGVVGGDWSANTAALGLTIAAVGASAAGAYALLDRTGAIVAGAMMMFVGTPFSGVSSAPELPQPVGLIGHLMPPGAGASLLRSTGFF